MTTDNLKSVFRFPFEDEEWLPKLGLYLLMGFGSILLIPAFFVAGYLYELRRRIVVDKAAPSLPDWENWDVLFVNGIKISAVSFIYMIPGFIVMFVGGFIPAFLIPLLTRSTEELAITGLFTTGFMWLGMGVGMLLYFLGSILTIVGTDHMIAKADFAAAFHLKELWCVFKHNVAGYLLTFVILMGLSMVATYGTQILMMTIILCCPGYLLMLLLMVYVGLVSSVLFAQAYVDGAAACEQPVADIVGEDVIQGEAT